jgi:hypothetical protein
VKAWPDWDEFVRRLREDPAFREEVRRQVLTEDLLNLPAVVSRVLNLQGQTLEAVRGMAAAVEAFVGEVRTALGRVEAQIATLAEQVRTLAKKTDDMDKTLSRHGQFVGVAWEVDAVRALKEVLRKRGVRLRGGFRTYALPMWEVDALAPAEDERGPLWVLLEVAGRPDPGDVWKLARYLEDPGVRAALGEFGVRGRVQAWVYALRRKVTAKGTPEEAASKCGVGLLDPEEGVLVEPTERVWEDERP